jgi:hypothetical protein
VLNWCDTAQRKAAAVGRWVAKHRARYNRYMAAYMRKYRQRKREAAS